MFAPAANDVSSQRLTCFAAHDWEPAVHVVDCFQIVKQFLEAHGLQLSEVSLMCSGWPKSKRLRSNDVVDEMRRHEDLDSIESRFGGDRDGAFVLIIGNSSPGAVIFCSAPDALLSPNAFQPLIEALAKGLFLNYGYVFTAEPQPNPAYFAFGIVSRVIGQSLPADGESQLEQWSNERLLKATGKRYILEGMMRDVYAVNILNGKHVSRMIHGRTLGEAIVANGWGELAQLENGTWLWSLRDTELEDARSKLRSAGVLICDTSLP